MNISFQKSHENTKTYESLLKRDNNKRHITQFKLCILWVIPNEDIRKCIVLNCNTPHIFFKLNRFPNKEN
jgi:hypothetical protein